MSLDAIFLLLLIFTICDSVYILPSRCLSLHGPFPLLDCKYMMQFDRLCNGWAFALLACFLPQLCIASPIADSRAEKRVAGPQVAPAAAPSVAPDATASLPTTGSVPQPATPFFYFPNNDQAENIKPRLNGQILVTINTSPVLYQIDPFRTQVGSIIHTFHGYTSLFGIVELQPDVFYLIAGNYTGAPESVPYGSPVQRCTSH